MATVTALLTIEEFNAQYACEHGYEYWFGEVVRKSVPTWLHGTLQAILLGVFFRLGYLSASEVDLRIDRNWQPRPDVAALLHVQQPYPTKPIDIVAEILSEDDSMHRLFDKCRNYARIGIPQIFVFDPELRIAWEWSCETSNLERIDTLRLANGSTLAVDEIWAELDARMQNPRHS